MFINKFLYQSFKIYIYIFLIGNQKFINKEKKEKKRKVQVVHDDEQEEKTNNTAKQEIRKLS